MKLKHSGGYDMKRTVKYFLIITVVISACCFVNVCCSMAMYDRQMNDISKKIIRFHVIANSNDAGDQLLKLKVRDAVLRYMNPKLEKCSNISESRKTIMDNDDSIRNVALNVIRENKYDYNVTTYLSHENFPAKSYGDISLPEWRYEAYRIVIENGKGQNWWCVMFPPLCFVDVTLSDENVKKADEKMKKVLTPDEYKIITQNDDNITMKFKAAEIIKKLQLKYYKLRNKVQN